MILSRTLVKLRITLQMYDKKYIFNNTPDFHRVNLTGIYKLTTFVSLFYKNSS